jgi:hypothetical protein
VTGPRRVAVVPSTLALLPGYAGVADPVSALRRAALAATAWLLEDAPDRVDVLASPQRPDNVARGVPEPAGWRVGRALLGEGHDVRTLAPDQPPSAEALLVVGNGSATRSEKAPGHLDEAGFVFDEEIGAALRAGDPRMLIGLDAPLGERVWCFDVPVFAALGHAVRGAVAVTVDHDDDPFGVQYWVVRWTCGS